MSHIQIQMKKSNFKKTQLLLIHQVKVMLVGVKMVMFESINLIKAILIFLTKLKDRLELQERCEKNDQI